VTATVEDLPGNSQSLVGHVATRTRTANFVAADFGKQFVGVINVSGEPALHSTWSRLGFRCIYPIINLPNLCPHPCPTKVGL